MPETMLSFHRGHGMFRTVYEIFAGIFLLQGALLIPMIAWSGFAWYRQMARFSALKKELGEDRERHGRTLLSLLQHLPKLQPLNCANCGSALALEGAASVCISCRAAAPLPEDYSATLSLRRKLRRLSRVAIREWLIARVLVSWPARIFFTLWIFVQPVMFGIVAIGAVEYGDTYLDRLIESMGDTWGAVLMGLSFAGFIMWMIVSIMLTRVAREMRHKLPVFPALVGKAAGGVEYANCDSCGGGIRFDARAFACLCDYCGVENYRAAHTRRERADTEAQGLSAQAGLFGPMEIIEDFTSTFSIVMTILLAGFALLALGAVLGGD